MSNSIKSYLTILIIAFIIDVTECQVFGGTWRQVGSDIIGEAGGDLSGYAVSISRDGKTVAIGAPLNDNVNGNNTGHVRVYSINTTSSSWTQVGLDINGEAEGDQFGLSVAISADGKTIAVGAPYNDNANNTDSGHVRVFSLHPTSGSWTQVGLDINGQAANDQSGWDVALSDDGKTVAIGALTNDGPSGCCTNIGQVRVYSINQTANRWIQVGSDIIGEAATDQSGRSIAISADGKTVAIGATNNDNINGVNAGHVRVYSLNSTQANWSQVGGDIDGEASGDSFGYSVALSANGRTVVIGGNTNNGNGALSGHARVYTFNLTLSAWVQVGVDIDGEAAQDLAGWGVSISGDGKTIAVGAPNNDNTNGANSGHVRLFSVNRTSSNLTQIGMDINGKVANDISGTSISLSDDGKTIAIGAYRNDNNEMKMRNLFYVRCSAPYSRAVAADGVVKLSTMILVFGFIRGDRPQKRNKVG